MDLEKDQDQLPLLEEPEHSPLVVRRSSTTRIYSQVTHILFSKRLQTLILLAASIFLIKLAASPKTHQLYTKHIESRIFSPTLPPFIPTNSRNLIPNAYLEKPKFRLDSNNGLYYPEPIVNKVQRANAALISLVRNEELKEMRSSMRQVEARFNRKFNYPWIFMNDQEFTPAFKKGVLEMTRSEVVFHTIPKSDWSYPTWINQTYAAEERAKMVAEKVMYGGSESYRFMCRWNSGFFYKQSVLAKYDYYWRVEPGISILCDVDYDVFKFMEVNKKVYGFTIALFEGVRTIETLWSTVQKFAKAYPEHIAVDNTVGFIVDDDNGLDSKYNNCHFWSNFEIGNLNFFRSQAYTDYFDFLESTGKFFYERWGDAPIHTIAVALMLNTSDIHHFDEIGYRHTIVTHLPPDESYYTSGICEGDPKKSIDLVENQSCLSKWWQVAGRYDL